MHQAGEARSHVGSGLRQLGLQPGQTCGLYSVNCRGGPHLLPPYEGLCTLKLTAFAACRLDAGGRCLSRPLSGARSAVRYFGAGSCGVHHQAR